MKTDEEKIKNWMSAFKPIPSLTGCSQARIDFLNGYGASIIRGELFYTDDMNHYEIAVVHGGRCCYTTPITDDVIGYQDSSGIEEILKKIAALPKQEEGCEDC